MLKLTSYGLSFDWPGMRMDGFGTNFDGLTIESFTSRVFKPSAGGEGC